jgi:hypothetical protein
VKAQKVIFWREMERQELVKTGRAVRPELEGYPKDIWQSPFLHFGQKLLGQIFSFEIFDDNLRRQ